MNIVYDRHGVQVAHGDNLDVLAELEDCSVDAVITDPPYGLGDHSPAEIITAITAWANGERDVVPDGRGFMGAEWDRFVPPPAVWDECYRVLKPGGHLAVFAGTRTVGLMDLSIRLAGFVPRDGIGVAGWCHSQGFPKSLDVGRAIDKVGGAEPRMQASVLLQARIRARMTRDAVAEAVGCSVSSIETWEEGRQRAAGLVREFIVPSAPFRAALAELLGYSADERRIAGVTGDRRGDGSVIGLGHSGVTYGTGSTDAAQQWNGWGTALKPAWEPIVLARKPLVGTVAQTVLEHGTGALNVAACRVGHSSPADLAAVRAKNPGRDGETTTSAVYGADRPQQSVNDAGRFPPNVLLIHHPDCGPEGDPAPCVPDCPVAEMNAQGDGAARSFPAFRWEPKAPTSERPQVGGTSHPTVKPLALSRWLARLLCQPGGLVVDMHAGSGTTGQACRAEGMRCLLVEKEPSGPGAPDYIALIRARLDARDRTPARSTGDTSGDEPLDLLDLLAAGEGA